MHDFDVGSYRIEGQAVDIRHPRQALDEGIAVVYQELELVLSLSVAENLFFGRLPHDRGGRVRWGVLYDESKKLLAEVGLELDPKTKVGHLGVAAQQLVEIARALACEPSYMLLDEPFAGIDPRTVEDIQNIVAELKSKGLGVLITDHNVRETLEITDRAYIIVEGKILTDGTAEELIADEQVRRIYLGERFSR